MTESSLLEAERGALRDLLQLASDRAQAEVEIEEKFQSRTLKAQRKRDADEQSVIIRFATQKENLENEYRKACQAIDSHLEITQKPLQTKHRGARLEIIERYKKEKEAAKAAFQEASWTLATIFEGNKNEAEEELKEVQGRIGSRATELGELGAEARKLLRLWKQDPDSLNVAAVTPRPNEVEPRNLPDFVAEAEQRFRSLRRLILPRVLQGKWYYALVLILVLLTAGVWYHEKGLEDLLLGGAIAAGILILSLVAKPLLSWAAKKQIARRYQPLCQTLEEAEIARIRALELAQAHFESRVEQCKQPHDKALRRVSRKYKRQRVESKRRRDLDLRQAWRNCRRMQIGVQRQCDQQSHLIEQKYRRAQADNQERYELDLKHVQERGEASLQGIQLDYDNARRQLASAWTEGIAQINVVAGQLQQENDRLFPPWTEAAWRHWTPPTVVPPVIRFGQLQVSLEEIPDGVPVDEQLGLATPPGWIVPAFLSFPDRCSLLLKASDDGRTVAVRALQTIMLRLLTALPAGKARFTIIDPVGLGQNFSAFMHLADYDEALVGSRIWTETSHIEQRLVDLTEHMELVIQKYLRNQYQTIEQYNAQAGEVAEPFRFLVVANFPVHFSTEAARRLLTIASSGARCGVYTLVSLDEKQALPQGFLLPDLEQASVNLTWKGERFVWDDPDFHQFPLELDAPPDADFVTRVLHVAGQKAREAGRVEVPFEFITPPIDQWWTADSRYGINVPLGRAGATKRQHLRLGQGTAHHVLIAGKTGSGKSTLLHALITNLSLNYSPQEVELYLVDFKEGVEFKPYATHALPHARLVAIESEREFGLSVLQRLDGELKNRGERFRAAGVQNLTDYRIAEPSGVMPRILLIIDEFQLFFVEDDRIAQEAALLLDRLVRQGRAFGIHVLLGSQTLGGAYSLARSTIGQMAVRIALQCNEADAHLILSDDNPAARLLSRPGEAIYNAANGLVQGNDFFQVVWINDDRREEYLSRIQKLADERHFVPPAPQIVFEGNAPADVVKNHLLHDVLLNHKPKTLKGNHAWLGEALAIKDPTAAVFRSQSGANLLIVGQNDESALAIMTTSLLSLAAQDSDSTKFYVVDGTPHDAPHSGFWAKVIATNPEHVRPVDRRELQTVLTEVAQEIDRRQKSHEAEEAPWFLFVYGLQRFRELRKPEDDFSFSRRGEEAAANPAKQFATIVREGPAVGVHTIVWCDTLNNVQRAFERQGLRDFEMRVLFQMSAADSSNLIDSPAAGKLGLYRALFYSEEKGQPEKFRPYGFPDNSWLDWVKEQLQGKRTLTV
jgi:energy-coupling factor transporter ATP-binding protein EcfA2